LLEHEVNGEGGGDHPYIITRSWATINCRGPGYVVQGSMFNALRAWANRSFVV
jgi:hypothetical protein